MRFKRLNEPETLLSITPLIDIVFLLLIFFMLTSHFHVASGVPIRLPKITQHAYEGEIKELNIKIDRNGLIYLKDEKIESKDLELKLHECVEKEHFSKVVLQADKETDHGVVVQVMDLSKKAGITSIVIAAQWDPEESF